ncbi:MAG: SWIM zinc finger family protein [Phycisphaerales bacterium]
MDEFPVFKDIRPQAEPRSKGAYQGAYSRKPDKPRRVQGGYKVPGDGWPGDDVAWQARAWVEWLRGAFSEEAFGEGLEYAQRGQVRRFSIDSGRVTGQVQGRRYKAYPVEVVLPRLSPGDWESGIALMVDQAVFAARILARELPEEVPGLFESAGVSLLPRAEEGAGIVVSCECEEHRRGVESGGEGEGGAGDRAARLCKHAACLCLVAVREMERDPLLVFTLRGLSEHELLERLRAQRSGASRAEGRLAPMPHALAEQPGIDAARRPLEECGDRFFSAGAGLSRIDTSVRRASVSHPLLRRLGPSPFKGSRFPLVGLLATCYDLVSEDAVRRAEEEQEREVRRVEGDGDGADGMDGAAGG